MVINFVVVNLNLLMDLQRKKYIDKENKFKRNMLITELFTALHTETFEVL